MLHTIEPWIIDKIEEERRRRQPTTQIPLYDIVPDPRQVPPGWEPDPDNRGGYRRKGDGGRERSDRGVVIIQM